MQSQTFVLLCGVVAVALLSSVASETHAMPAPPQCQGFLEEVPQRIRKVCAALSTIYELSSAMEAYLDEKALYQNHDLMDTGVKRQDVDHVFLRFGRRR